MAGLAAAWELSRPEHRDRIGSVTLYERRPYLGGKAASVRGPHGRIEEHGLHVWLGYYDNAFRLIREVYDELDREHTDPACPIRTWREAFRPSDVVGAGDRDGAPPWMARFARNGLEPGDPERPARPLTSPELVGRAVDLLVDIGRSLSRRDPHRPPQKVFLSSSADPTGRRRASLGSLAEFGDAVRMAEVGAIVAAVQALTLLDGASAAAGPLRRAIEGQLVAVRADLEDRLAGDVDAVRARALVDLVVTVVRGMVTDRLLGDPERLSTIDHLDFRAWLLGHGARPETVWCPLVNAMYDFVFAYEDGDPDRPTFAAGLGLFLATKLFFEYRGAIFWKLEAGMGDVVMAPLHQALERRGVRIELGWDVRAVHLDGDRSAPGSIDLSGAAGGDGPALVTVKGLPCYPRRDGPDAHRAESASVLRLERGRDFDDVVLAVSLGALPTVAADLVAASPRWQAMVSNVSTVATQGFQAWLTASEDELGWCHGGATVSGRARPFDTYASMSHLLPVEDWPADDGPAGLAYFCGAQPEAGPGAAAAAHTLLSEHVADVWPATDGGGFRGDVLHGGFAAQHFATNDDASDRYVQSRPGSARWRLRADEAGFDHVALAGDWINSGLNAGCIEAAVIAGRQAANVLLGRPLTDGIAGALYGLAVPPVPDGDLERAS